jgi:hypothetical protein
VAESELSLWDRFVNWVNALFGQGALPTTEDSATGPDCDHLLALTRAHGLAMARALWMREIQHQGGREGFAQGGWVGAITGGIAGTEEAIKGLRDCEARLGAELTQADDAWRTERAQLRDTKEACLARCEATHGPGAARRDCKQACRQQFRDDRGPTALGAWLKTFLP